VWGGDPPLLLNKNIHPGNSQHSYHHMSSDLAYYYYDLPCRYSLRDGSVGPRNSMGILSKPAVGPGAHLGPFLSPEM